jgi:hypothetical protein
MKAIRSYVRRSQETESERTIRLNKEIERKKKRRKRNLNDTKENCLTRLRKERMSKMNERFIEFNLESNDERSRRLRLKNERESIRWRERCESETDDSRIRRKLRKRNIDQS